MNLFGFIQSRAKSALILATTIASAVVTTGAQASPYVDPALAPYITGHQLSNRPIKFVALFYDSQAVPFLSNSAATYRDMRYAMMNNAERSQQKVLSDLNKNGFANKSTRRLWLSNAMIIEMPADQVKTLLQYNEIKALVADHKVSIFRPQDRGPRPQFTPSFNNEPQYTYGLKKLAIPQLRQQFPTLDGRGVNVGILDTGIDASHPDLLGKTVAFKDFANKKTGAPYDDHGHGTHVAGTIAGGAASNIAIGVAPGAKLTVAKVFTASGSANLTDLMEAMQWVSDPDGNPETKDSPSLVSNSWGGGQTTGQNDPLKDSFCRAVDGWVKLGILPVFAAGNSGSRASSVELPGACPSAFAVGATDEGDKIAYFSSRGPALWANGPIMKPNVSAPGVAVTSSVPGGQYRAMDGTSMATPHVSGVGALVAQGKPFISVNDLAALITRGVEDLGEPGPDTAYGTGRVNALKSIAPMTYR